MVSKNSLKSLAGTLIFLTTSLMVIFYTTMSIDELERPGGAWTLFGTLVIIIVPLFNILARLTETEEESSKGNSLKMIDLMVRYAPLSFAIIALGIFAAINAMPKHGVPAAMLFYGALFMEILRPSLADAGKTIKRITARKTWPRTGTQGEKK